MNLFIATKEEFETCGHSINRQLNFEIDTPYGTKETVYIEHKELLTDECELLMIRANHTNLISRHELECFMPLQEEVI